MVSLDMLGFDSLDDYLARRMTAAELVALTPEQKRERRLAQHRAFRARRSASKLLHRRPAAVALHGGPKPTPNEPRSTPHRDYLGLTSISPVDGRMREVFDLRSS
jgi:hypothetical protein